MLHLHTTVRQLARKITWGPAHIFSRDLNMLSDPEHPQRLELPDQMKAGRWEEADPDVR